MSFPINMFTSGSTIVVSGTTGSTFQVNVILSASIANFSEGLSGSLQQTNDGLSYLVAGKNTSIVSQSNGQIIIGSTITGDTYPSYIVLSSTSSLSNERVLTVSGSSGLLLNDSGSNNNVSLSINDNIVATISGTTFTGAVTASAGIVHEPRWDDLIGAIDQASAAAALEYQVFRDTPIKLYHFQYNKDESLYLRFHMPHTWNLDEVRPHLHIVPMGSGSGTVVFCGYYTWSRADTGLQIPDLSGWTPFTSSYDITPDMQYCERAVWLFRSAPTGSVAHNSANLMIYLCRKGLTNPEDTYHASNPYGNASANIGLLFLDVHYRKSKMGTYKETDVLYNLPPTITQLLVTSSIVGSLTASITSLRYDQPNLLWQWNTTGTTPVTSSGWSSAIPTMFSASAYGSTTFSLWAMNDIFNISQPVSATVNFSV